MNQYVITERQTGEQWMIPFSDRVQIDCKRAARKWVKEHFAGEVAIDPPIDESRLCHLADYCIEATLDGRLWTSAGFYLKTTN